MIFDAGVFDALENRSKHRVVLALLRHMRDEDVLPTTSAAVLAKVWRDPKAQRAVSMLVDASTVHDFGDPRVVGIQCALAGTNDIADASLAVLASQLEMTIVTTKPDAMARLGVSHAAL